jgi:hypothetical protein
MAVVEVKPLHMKVIDHDSGQVHEQRITICRRVNALATELRLNNKTMTETYNNWLNIKR